jgi:hypothetical protein
MRQELALESSVDARNGDFWASDVAYSVWDQAVNAWTYCTCRYRLFFIFIMIHSLHRDNSNRLIRWLSHPHHLPHTPLPAPLKAITREFVVLFRA